MPLAKHTQASESYLMAGILAVTGGFLDAYTFVSRDGVFANAQTGNICRLALALVDMDALMTVRYLIPILSFVAGTLLTEGIHRALAGHRRLHWRQAVVLLEMALLSAVALIPDGAVSNIAANVLVSGTCAIQGQAFRKFLGNTFASTMCTGNLRSASEQFSRFIAGGGPAAGKKSLQYFGVDLLFLGGVMLGAWCTRLWVCRAVLVCVATLAAAFLLMFRQPEEL